MEDIWMWGAAAVGAVGVTVMHVATEYFKHREKLAELQSKGSNLDSGRMNQLQQRVDALEKQCAKLQEQVLTAHEQLADERRALDNKLAAILPEIPPATSSPVQVRSPQASKTIG
jgi:uncharacterized protein YlxW (UPF0749 family)